MSETLTLEQDPTTISQEQVILVDIEGFSANPEAQPTSELGDAEVDAAFENLVTTNFDITPEEGERLKAVTKLKGSSRGNLMITAYC